MTQPVSIPFHQRSAVIGGAVYLSGAVFAYALLRADILSAHAAGIAIAILVGFLGFRSTADTNHPDAGFVITAGTLALAATVALIFVLTLRSNWPSPAVFVAMAVLVTAATLIFTAPHMRRAANRFAGSIVPSLVAVWLAGIVYTASRDINHDTAWYLASISNWIGGEALYVGVFEVNPPLAFYVYAPSVVFSKLFGVDETASLIGWIYLLIACSLVWCYRISNRCLSADRRDWLMLTIAIAMIASPIADFAQREQLLLILAMPYLLTLALQPAEAGLSRFERALVGLVAVFGLALKPHYLAAPLLMIGVRVLQKRDPAVAFRAENIAVGAGCLSYPLFIYLVHPAYLQNVVPFAVDFYGAGYGGASFLEILTIPSMLCAMVLVALVRFFPLEEETDQRIAEVMAAALAGFAIAYLLQNMGWFYHRVPMVAFLGILGGWMFFHLYHDRTRLIGAVIAALIAGNAIVVRPIMVADLMFAPPVSQFIGAFPSDMKGRSISAFTFHLGAGFPLTTRLNAHWASRFPCQWLIPGALAAQQSSEPLTDTQTAAIDKVLDFTRTATVDDLVRYRPDFVLVDYDGSPTPEGNPFQFLEFLSADPRFADAWSHYEKHRTILGVEIWRRRDVK